MTNTPPLPNRQLNECDYIRAYHDDFLEGEVGFTEHGTSKRYDEILHLIGYGMSFWNSVLEVGCGPNGGLLKYTDFAMPKYKGIDINPKYIERSNDLVENEPGLFEHANILTQAIDEQYDYVIASGIFCYDYDGAEIVNESIISEMFSLAKKAVVVNFIPSTAPGSEKIKSNGILQYDLPMIDSILGILPEGIGYSIIADKYPNNMTLVLQRLDE